MKKDKLKKDIEKETIVNIDVKNNEFDLENEDIGIPLIPSPKIKTLTFMHGLKKLTVLDAKSTLKYIRETHKQLNNLTRILNGVLKENENFKQKIVLLIKKHKASKELLDFVIKHAYGDLDDVETDEKKKKNAGKKE